MDLRDSLVRTGPSTADPSRAVPILVKLGDFGDVEHTVRFLARLRIDGLVGLNTQKDYETFAQRLPAADRKVTSGCCGAQSGVW